MTWLLVFLGGISLRTWIIVGATALFGLWTVHWYNVGVHHERAAWTALIAKERADQSEASRKAGEEAFVAIDKLISKTEAQSALIETLNAEGDADPDSSSGGITSDSLRRINRSRAPGPK